MRIGAKAGYIKQYRLNLVVVFGDWCSQNNLNHAWKLFDCFRFYTHWFFLAESIWHLFRVHSLMIIFFANIIYDWMVGAIKFTDH
jgi:hypothetical protein